MSTKTCVTGNHLVLHKAVLPLFQHLIHSQTLWQSLHCDNLQLKIPLLMKDTWRLCISLNNKKLPNTLEIALIMRLTSKLVNRDATKISIVLFYTHFSSYLDSRSNLCSCIMDGVNSETKQYISRSSEYYQV